MRRTVRFELCIRYESMSPSTAAVNAPAAGPMSSAAAMLNVSEIEKLIGIDGTRRASHPARTVSERKTTKAGDSGPVPRLPRGRGDTMSTPGTDDDGHQGHRATGSGVDQLCLSMSRAGTVQACAPGSVPIARSGQGRASVLSADLVPHL